MQGQTDTPPKEETTHKSAKGLAARLCLAVVSVLLAVLLCEAALRILLPKYRNVAEGRLQADKLRLYAPRPNNRDWRVHPDTRRRHPFHTNNLGMRQHRDFSEAALVATTTVGVFGDSFVRASYLDAPHVFTEPLDYLLNLDGDFTVLNFGVGGYDPAQSYFTYRSFHAREELDYVLFVYFGGNDLRGLVRNRLVYLDDDGQLRQGEARGSAWWVPFVSRLHLTYLALDASGRLGPYVANAAEQLLLHRDTWSYRLDVSDDLLDHGAEVFGQLASRWAKEVEESGGRFFVVLLPTQPAFPRVLPLLTDAGVGVVDLNACVEARDEGHRERDWQDSPYRLRNDPHWNELGNRLAAACLDAELRRNAGLPAMTEAAREAALTEYYAAFEDPRPIAQPARALVAGEAIRRKYQALGGFETADVRTESWLSPNRLALDSEYWDVYVNGPSVIFANDDCHADHATERLFVHATPIDAASILPANTSFLPLSTLYAPLQEGGRCIVRWRVPVFPFSHILVGQRDSAKAMLWSGEIVLDQAAFEKELEGMLIAAGEPIIESDMDVHVHGQLIFYVSDDCQRTDGHTPFFLHVTPAREADLPPERIEHGYDNRDFFQVGATVGERCVVRWHLPDYPIRHIRTGQYVVVQDGEDVHLPRLWEGEAQVGG